MSPQHDTEVPRSKFPTSIEPRNGSRSSQVPMRGCMTSGARGGLEPPQMPVRAEQVGPSASKLRAGTWGGGLTQLLESGTRAAADRKRRPTLPDDEAGGLEAAESIDVSAEADKKKDARRHLS